MELQEIWKTLVREMGKGKGRGTHIEGHLSILSSTTTGATSRSTTAARLESSTRSLATSTSAATRSTTAWEATAELFVGTSATLLDLDLDVVNIVRIGSNGGLETSRGLEVDESAVLVIY